MTNKKTKKERSLLGSHTIIYMTVNGSIGILKFKLERNLRVKLSSLLDDCNIVAIIVKSYFSENNIVVSKLLNQGALPLLEPDNDFMFLE